MPDATRVLVVDDEPNMRKSLADILRDEGYEIATAEDGYQAIEQCSQGQFDVILMDVRMPGINGVDAFRQIHRLQPGIRVILMSAYGVDDLKQEALRDGAIAFLDKPLDIEQVVRLIEQTRESGSLLVVEPDDSTADSLSQMLRDQGYHVTVVPTPQDALDLIGQLKFEVILIDVELPTMTGLDLYLAVKRLTPATVAIMITGGEEHFKEMAREAVRSTAYTFLQKPLDLNKLIEHLERIRRQRVSSTFWKPDEEE